MLHFCPKPTNRWSIVTGQIIQQSEDPEASREESGETHEDSVFLRVNDAVAHRQDTMTSDCRPADQASHSSQKDLSTHLLKGVKCRTSPIVPECLSVESTFYGRFHKYWHHQKILGEGADGVVHLYQQTKQRDMCVAVKLPRCRSARDDLEQEILNMRIIGRHEHILGLCFATEDWYPYGPAIFLPYCDLGNIIDYRRSWCAQQRWEGQPERISEITMWKLFKDMVLALEYLHSQLGTRYVHNDFKPANILAVVPPDQDGCHILPEEPIFKLSDFARLTPWPTPKGKPEQCFEGTPEYAPPIQEQIAPVHPSADIWGLGATLQYMALGIVPVQSREAFIRERKAKGKLYPELGDRFEWASEYWRSRIPTIFRPINVPLMVLQKDYDLLHDLPGYQQYSARLGYWYAQLWNPVSSRPKAAMLAACAIPYMDDMVERLKLERVKQMCEDENSMQKI